MNSTLHRLIRHAEVYGVEFVFESAVGDLAADELEALARRLARIDPKWRFPETWANGQSSAANPHSRAAGCNANSDLNSPGKLAVCAVCGVKFPARRSTARYCSAACRVRAHRRAS
jgi:hypothetical protein